MGPSRLLVPPPIQRHYWWSSKAPKSPVDAALANGSAPLGPPETGSSSSFPASSAETAGGISSASTMEELPPTNSLPLEAIPTEPLTGVADTISGPIIHHLGDFAAHGITSWINPSGLYVWATELVHVATGTPWWLTVIFTSIALRGILVRLTIRGMQETEKLRPVQPKMNTLQNAIQAAVKKGDKIGAARIQMELKDVIASTQANPLIAPASGVLNMIISFAAFFGVRRIATMPDSPFIHGGVLWFENLSAPDPILAVVSVPFMMWTARTAMRDGLQPTPGQSGLNHMPNWFPALMPLLSIPFLWFPSAQVIVIITNSGLMVLQSQIMRLAWVRTKLGLPPYVGRTIPPIRETYQWVREYLGLKPKNKRMITQPTLRPRPRRKQ